MFEPLALFNTLVTLGLLVGGVVAYRHGFAQTANEVQERVINALQTEIQTLHDRISILEEENTRLNRIMSTLCASLKRRGISVSVDGDAVSILEHGDGPQDAQQGTDAAPQSASKRHTRKRAPHAEGAA